MTALIQEIVAGQSERRPEAAAILAGEGLMTYRGLDSTSNQIARRLREAGCRRGDRVCVITPRSAAAAAVGVLGAFKADAIVVALEEGCSTHRLVEIARSSDPICILTTTLGQPLVERLIENGAVSQGTAVGVLDRDVTASRRNERWFGASTIARASIGPIGSHNRASNAACLMFSEVDGEPGVVWTHAGLSRFVNWVTEYFGVQPADSHPLVMPQASARAMCQILAALAGGATLVEGQSAGRTSSRTLARFVRRSDATLWWCSPETIADLAEADSISPGDFPSLRHAVCWSPGIRRAHFHYWRTRLRHASFTVLMGAPETMMASSYYTVGDGVGTPDDQLPVGVACPGHEVVLLDGERQPVGAGQMGSIHVRGVGLSPGYWRSPEATLRAFGTPSTSAGSQRSFHLGLRGRRGPDGRIYTMLPSDVRAS